MSLIDGRIVEDLGKERTSRVTGILITGDGKWILRSSVDGMLKQWNYEDMTVVRKYGSKTDRIMAMCL